MKSIKNFLSLYLAVFALLFVVACQPTAEQQAPIHDDIEVAPEDSKPVAFSMPQFEQKLTQLVSLTKDKQETADGDVLVAKIIINEGPEGYWDISITYNDSKYQMCDVGFAMHQYFDNCIYDKYGGQEKTPAPTGQKM